MRRGILPVFSLILFFLATKSYAAPAPTGYTGTVTHGQTITISGSNFGTKSTAAPNLWDTVDNQASYSGLSDGDFITVGGANPWEDECYYGGCDAMLYETTGTEQRGVSTAAYKAVDANYATLLGRTVTDTGNMYVSWWYKPNQATDTAHSNKFLRLSDSSDTENLTFSWTTYHNYTFINPCNPIDWENYSGATGEWNLHEVWINSTSETYVIRVNGTTIASVDYSACGPASFDYIKSIGYEDGGGAPVTIWMDDIYVDNTFSRMMIGNASTYAASTHFEMQIPSSWSASSVVVTVNRGSFAVNDNAYLYIVDADGVANSSGYPVTFGTESTLLKITASGSFTIH